MKKYFLSYIKKMGLTIFFRLHACFAVSYALSLLLIPRKFIEQFSKDSLVQPGLEITRLFGASLVFIALMAWEAGRTSDLKMRKVVARSLFIYALIGFINLLCSQLGGHWNRWGWLNILSYFIFIVGYGYCLLKNRIENEVRKAV